MERYKSAVKSILWILFFAVILTTYMSGGLYARYSTAAGDSDSARVAKFDIEIDGTTISKTEHLTIKDFKPGDSIEHKIKVVIDSEVSVKCTIKVITTGNLPLTFKIDANELNAVTKILTYEQNVDPTGSTTVEILKTLEINYVTDGISDNYMDSHEVDIIDIIVTAEQID